MSKTLYLVTGAMGYLGNTIISKLAAQGKLIRGLALPNDNTISYTQPNVEIVHGDVRDKDSLTSFFSHNPDTELIVIHTAAIVSISSKVDKKVVDVNVNGTKNIVELCLRHKVKKLVHTSSVHAIPEKSHGETAAGCDSEKKARGETASTPEARIADFRAKIAERKAATGIDYLSFYYMEASSYEIAE